MDVYRKLENFCLVQFYQLSILVDQPTRKDTQIMLFLIEKDRNSYFGCIDRTVTKTSFNRTFIDHHRIFHIISLNICIHQCIGDIFQIRIDLTV